MLITTNSTRFSLFAVLGVLCFLAISACNKKQATQIPKAPGDNNSMKGQVAQPSSLPAATSQAITDFPHQVACTVYPQTLGQTSVEVYGSMDPTDKHYLIRPYIWPEWATFRSQYLAKCNERAPSKVVKLVVPFTFAALAVNKEIAYRIGKSCNIPAPPPGLILSYPFAVLKIVTGEKVRWVYPNLSENVSVAVQTQPLIEKQNVTLTDSCERLQEIWEGNDIKGEMYSEFGTVKRNSMAVAFAGAEQRGFFKKLELNEKSTGGIRTISTGTSSGAGISVGPLSIGETSGEQTGEVQDTRARLISANVIAEAATKYVTELKLTCFGQETETEACDPNVAKTLVDFVLSRSEKVQATFTETAGVLTLHAQGLEDRVLNTTERETVMKGSPPPALGVKDNTTAKVPYEGIPLELQENREMNLGGSTEGISWTVKDGGWVPTSADLRLVSAATLSSDISAEAQGTFFRKQKGLQGHPLTLIVIGKGDLTPVPVPGPNPVPPEFPKCKTVPIAVNFGDTSKPGRQGEGYDLPGDQWRQGLQFPDAEENIQSYGIEVISATLDTRYLPAGIKVDFDENRPWQGKNVVVLKGKANEGAATPKPSIGHLTMTVCYAE